MVDKRLEIHEEQCRFSLDRREDDILQDEEIGLPLHNELALDILETKLKNKEFFESMALRNFTGSWYLGYPIAATRNVVPDTVRGVG
ncbi:hypothetical protein EAG_02528 [Camponotus floridanus]|uniref:Uncharacterized protein n=1 Tax=Camponotus floridanus TaxID=104421 RepID=E2AWR6_CAMFO|nr:hypothetical protein EAG_02528 [Camponotus floridanus]